MADEDLKTGGCMFCVMFWFAGIWWLPWLICW